MQSLQASEERPCGSSCVPATPELALPHAKFVGTASQTLTLERCYFADGMQTDLLPLPMVGQHEGWRLTEFDTATSFDGRRSFRKGKNFVEGALAPSALAESRGEPKSNPGLTTFTPGSTVQFGLELSGSPAANVTAASSAGRHSATLTYLSSYEGMGAVRVSCSSGCSCIPAELDGHRGAQRKPRYVSVWEDGELLLDSWVGTCVLTVE
eukprot:1702697-Prymnesium_polylepis.3